MATYLIFNLLFLTLLMLFMRVRPRRPSRGWWVMLVVLLVLTAVFDSLIVYYQVVGYDALKILRIYVGAAPIEDFFYAVAAALIVPTLWVRSGSRRNNG